MSNIEEHIRRAMEQGKFDNLPGKGKPLNLNENPLKDPDWRLAHQMLRSGGFSLPWIETYREIEKELDNASQSLARTWAWRQASRSGEETPDELEFEWQRAVKRFRQKICCENLLLTKYFFYYTLKQELSIVLNKRFNLSKSGKEEICGC